MKTKVCILFFITLLFFGGLFFIADNIFAADYYLDPANGNNSNNGSITSPWKTMNKVIVSLSPGDTVYIKGGTYTEEDYLDVSSSAYTKGNLLWTNTDSLGTANNPITIKAAPGETVIFDAGYNGIERGPHFINFIANNQAYSGHYVIIEDLKFRNYKTPVLDIEDGAKNILINNCSFTDIFDSESGAVHIESSNNIIVRNSRFENIGDTTYSFYGNPDHGIYVAEGSKNILLDNNFIKQIAGYPVHLWGHSNAFLTTEKIIVRRNRLKNPFGPPATSTEPATGGIVIGGTNYDRVYFYHNSFWADPGLSKQPKSVINVSLTDDGRIDNLKIKNNSGAGYFMTSFGASYIRSINVRDGFYFDYNIWYNLAAVMKTYRWDSILYNLTGFQTATIYEDYAIEANPLYTDVASDNFTLQTESRAINAGDFLTKTVGSGNGLNITLEDAGYFFDGYDLIEGDTIQIGSNVVKVTDINYATNVITTDRVVSWSDGAGVSLPYSGAKPDMGAYEYAAAFTDTTPPAPPTGLVVL